MGWFILIGAIFLVSLVIVILTMTSYDYAYDMLSMISGTIAVFAAAALIIMGLSLINRERYFDGIVNEYQMTKELVESYNGGEYGNISSLTESMLDINERIAMHKAYLNNKWSGIWYSEKVANLEPLTFKKVE